MVSEGFVEKYLPSWVSSQGVFLAMDLKEDLITFSGQVLLLIVSIGTLTVEVAALGQINVHSLQGGSIVKAASHNKIVYWKVISRYNQLDLESIKVFFFSFIIAVVGLALKQFTNGNSTVTAYATGKESIT